MRDLQKLNVDKKHGVKNILKIILVLLIICFVIVLHFCVFRIKITHEVVLYLVHITKVFDAKNI